MRKCLSRLALCWALLVAPAVSADPQSRSWSQWHWQGEDIVASFVVPRREVGRLAAHGETGSAEKLLNSHLRQTLSLARDSAPCELRDANPQRAAATYMAMQLRWHCPGTGRSLMVRNQAFQVAAPSHIHFATFTPPGGEPFEQLFTRRQNQQQVELGDTDPGDRDTGNVWEVAKVYTLLGFEHILIGADHIAFLLGLMLLSLGWRDVILVVTGFTIGHSVTLALTVLGKVSPDPLWVEGLIGYTIAVVAVENVLAGDRRQRHAALAIGLLLATLAAFAAAGLPGPDPLSLLGLALFSLCYLQLAKSAEQVRQWRPLITLLFGLVHGFGFAGIMLEVGLPENAVIPALAGFNLGVELGQIALVLGLALLGRLSWRQLPLQLPANVALCGLGVFWFAERLYF
jgi:hypothetical protein